jgi:hypothetical protein
MFRRIFQVKTYIPHRTNKKTFSETTKNIFAVTMGVIVKLTLYYNEFIVNGRDCVDCNKRIC